MRLRNTIASSILLATSFTICAHEGMHGPGAELDVDGSGGISLNEFYESSLTADLSAEESKTLFDELDRDQSLELSSTEYLRAINPDAV